jgi:hypothetical protein
MMRPAIGFQLFVLLVAACIFAAAASTPSSSDEHKRDDESSYQAELDGYKHGGLWRQTVLTTVQEIPRLSFADLL